jgi:hypothetical protein
VAQLLNESPVLELRFELNEAVGPGLRGSRGGKSALGRLYDLPPTWRDAELGPSSSCEITCAASWVGAAQVKFSQT